MSKLNASQRLMDLVFNAVQEGLLPLKEKKDPVPFALLHTKNGLVMQRYVADSTVQSLEKARAALGSADEDTLAYALVYDAYVTIDGADQDALMIEAGERGQSKGVRFVQRYNPPTESAPLIPIGEVAFLGRADQLLKDA